MAVEPKTGFKMTVDLPLKAAVDTSIHICGEGMLVVSKTRIQFWKRVKPDESK